MWLRVFFIHPQVLGRHSRERTLRVLQLREDASPAMVAALRRFTGSQEEVETCCDIIAEFASLDDTAQAALVGAGALSVVLDQIVGTDNAAPVCSFSALRNLVSVGLKPDAVTVNEVHRQLVRVVDAAFVALTINLVSFDAECDDDASVLSCAGITLSSVMSYLTRHKAECFTPLALVYGVENPDRIPALVNAVRLSCSSAFEGIDGGCNATAFVGTMRFMLDAAK